jgi:two-component system, OmpR family, phosphate regulon sensor histidine kinase PhoR
VTFRTRLFLTSVAAAALTLALATSLASWSLRRTVAARVERTLVEKARLAAETLANRRAATPDELDAEAHELGRLVSARITFIAADGRVVGDSALSREELAAVENHADRPEVVQARREGLGVARRSSETVGADMLYVAVPVANPQAPDLAVVRLALPLLEVRDQVWTIARSAVIAFAAGLLPALLLAWLASLFLSRRVRAIAADAARYAAGDFTAPGGEDFSPARRDYGSDEIGTVARVLDESARELGRRIAELRADRERVAAILGGMVEGVVVVDDAGRLRLVNEAARRLLNVDADWAGRHYLEFIRAPDITVQIGYALRGITPEGREMTLPREPRVHLVVRAAPVAAGSRRGAVLVLHDITDLKRADQIRRDFVANVSHELRTPLTAIRGYVEALIDEQADGVKARQFLDTIARHTARMERLVQDLLRLARLDAGQEAIERVECSTEALLAGAAAELSAALESRRQAVDVTVAPDAVTVTGDPAKLHDALRNLAENAIKHAPEASRIRLAAERRADAVVLSVADEGPGIPEADLPRVFERFYRVDKARSRDGRDPGGTGLGLSIVKHLVELHGGTVRAANRAGGGALFEVELPAAAPDSGEPT